MLPEQHHRHQHAAPRAGIQAHHVRAPEGVTHQRLEYRAADAKRRAHQDRHRHARQSPFGDHHGDVTRRAAAESVKDLREIKRYGTALQAPDRQQQTGDDQQGDAGK